MRTLFVLPVERLLDPASRSTFRLRCRASVGRPEIVRLPEWELPSIAEPRRSAARIELESVEELQPEPPLAVVALIPVSFWRPDPYSTEMPKCRNSKGRADFKLDRDRVTVPR
jgi:hypothetical protein